MTRVFVWSAPRCRSTVFMKCVTSGGDIKSYLEPYSVAEHYGPKGRLRPLHEITLEPTYTAASIKTWLESEPFHVFVKDQAYAIDGQYQYLPEGYRHSFLIRRPDLLYKSFYRVFQRKGGGIENNLLSFLPKGTNVVKSMWDLLEHVEMSSQDVCIIDSDDILSNPVAMIRTFCNKMGLSYNSGLLQWKQGIPDTWVVAKTPGQYGYGWYDNAIQSTGWGKGITHYEANDHDFPEYIKDLIEEAMPYYQKLQNHPKRIRLDNL